jgi:tripartite-type tricarboxylate transporter receptor subunit TctC
MLRWPAFLFLALAGLGAALAPGTAAHAADFPSRPIRIIVPYPPGGGADLLARLVGQQLGERLKQTVVVENQGGASNTIGINAVAKSAADGHVLGLVTPVFVMTPSLMKDHPYEPLKDLVPVAMVGYTPLVLVVHPGVRASTVGELVALARERPGALNFASLGSATTQGLAGFMFNAAAGVETTQIAYKGSAPGVTDLLGGTVQFMFNALPSMLQHVQSGRLRALGVTGAQRSPLLPGVPTVGETLEGYEVVTWYGFVAPAGTPRAVVERLNREVGAILALPEVRERLRGAGLEPDPMSPADFGALLQSESAKWSRVISSAKLPPA